MNESQTPQYRNLHKYFFQGYYDGVKWDEETGKDCSERNKPFFEDVKLQYIPHPFETDDKRSVPKEWSVLKGKVLYPGLVTGIGLPHRAKIRGEFQLGMHFDWTYGMPVIYGSSVKGAILSNIEAGIELYNECHKNQMIPTVTRNTFEDFFGEDVFFDAIILGFPQGKSFLAPDAITKHPDDPFKNPIPIPFLKIAPGCTMEFRFLLHDSGLFTQEVKRDLFSVIISTFGIGAKTNVGYGRFEMFK